MEKHGIFLMFSGPREGLIQVAARVMEERYSCSGPEERTTEVTAVRKQVDAIYILEKEPGFSNGLVLQCVDEGQRPLKAVSAVSGLSSGVAGSAIYSEEEDGVGAGLRTVRC